MNHIVRAPLVWLDMEMTGLDVERCVPIQVAVVITDDELRERDSLELTIWQPDSVLETIEPFVRKMHTSNGLLQRVKRSETGLADAERQLMQLLTKWCPYGTGVLAGNSIHTDRLFIRKYFPVVDRYLNYRMVDVSSFKEMMVRWYGPASGFDKSLQLHTALEDIRESIAELRYYRERFFRDNPKPAQTDSQVKSP